MRGGVRRDRSTFSDPPSFLGSGFLAALGPGMTANVHPVISAQSADAPRQPKALPMTAPKVLISDALSPAAVQIFKDRGIDVTFDPGLGKDKDRLAAIIGEYDGLAIRSATKATAKLLSSWRMSAPSRRPMASCRI